VLLVLLLAITDEVAIAANISFVSQFSRFSLLNALGT